MLSTKTKTTSPPCLPETHCPPVPNMSAGIWSRLPNTCAEQYNSSMAHSGRRTIAWSVQAHHMPSRASIGPGADHCIVRRCPRAVNFLYLDSTLTHFASPRLFSPKDRPRAPFAPIVVFWSTGRCWSCILEFLLCAACLKR